MPAYFAPSAMLPQGWAASVRIEVDQAGFIIDVKTDAEPQGCERLAGSILPGMPNLHSHAFQRAMAGLAERTAGQTGRTGGLAEGAAGQTGRTGGAGDDFWGWRKVMYGFLAALQPEDVASIAAQLYLEMARAGYTAVGEFHYLHHAPGGEPYADRAELSRRVVGAAVEVGLGITHLPVLYARGGFAGEALAPQQRRFQNDVAGLADIMAAIRLYRLQGQTGQVRPRVRLGIALGPDDLPLAGGLKRQLGAHPDLANWLITLSFGRHQSQGALRRCDETLRELGSRQEQQE